LVLARLRSLRTFGFCPWPICATMCPSEYRANRISCSKSGGATIALHGLSERHQTEAECDGMPKGIQHPQRSPRPPCRLVNRDLLCHRLDTNANEPVSWSLKRQEICLDCTRSKMDTHLLPACVPACPHASMHTPRQLDEYFRIWLGLARRQMTSMCFCAAEIYLTPTSRGSLGPALQPTHLGSRLVPAEFPKPRGLYVCNNFTLH
jgi:hypothetical protein